MTAREPWRDAREYLAAEAAQVEALIAGMPPAKQADYLASSKPHAALHTLDALVETLRRVQFALDGWAVFREPQHYAVHNSGEMRDILDWIAGALEEPNSQKEPA